MRVVLVTGSRRSLHVSAVRLPPVDSWSPEDFARRAVAVDFESHNIQPGLLAPPVVVGACAGPEGAGLLYPAEAALDYLERLVRDPDAIIVNANIAYDLGLLVAARPYLLRFVIDALEAGRVFDTLIGMTLDWIARGMLDDGKLYDPRGGLLKKSSGKNAERFSLDVCHKVLTGLDDAKDNDFWKLRYAILERVALEHWPDPAKEYPVDDARNALRHAHILVGAAPRAEFHEYRDGACWRCGAKPGCGTMCQVTAPARNLGNMTLQTRAAFAYQIGGIHGMRVDLERVAKMRAVADELHAKALQTFEGAGILRGPTHPDCQPRPWKGRPGKFTAPKYKVGTEDWKRLATLVAIAYGTDPLSQCTTCAGAAKAPVGKNGSMVDCPACGATGLELAPSVPRTETGWVSGERDTLKESGDDLLDEYGDVSENERLRTTYLPFLEQGRVQNPGVNILLVSGRVSYYGLWQLFPRRGGIRECLVAGFDECVVEVADGYGLGDGEEWVS